MGGRDLARIFVALPVDDAVRGLAAESSAAFARAIAQRAGAALFAQTRPERLHVTLAFLGEIESARLETVFTVTSEVARRHEEFLAEAGGMGAFPRASAAHVLWLGFDDAARGSLRRLADGLRAGLRRAGFELEERPFRGHVTLARVRSDRPFDARDVLARAPARRVSCRVAELVVMESRNASRESEYVPLFRARLASATRAECV